MTDCVSIGGGDDGIGQADVDAAYCYQDGVASVDMTSDNQAIAADAYANVESVVTEEIIKDVMLLNEACCCSANEDRIE